MRNYKTCIIVAVLIISILCDSNKQQLSRLLSSLNHRCAPLPSSKFTSSWFTNDELVESGILKASTKSAQEKAHAKSHVDTRVIRSSAVTV